MEKDVFYYPLEDIVALFGDTFRLDGDRVTVDTREDGSFSFQIGSTAVTAEDGTIYANDGQQEYYPLGVSPYRQEPCRPAILRDGIVYVSQGFQLSQGNMPRYMWGKDYPWTSTVIFSHGESGQEWNSYKIMTPFDDLPAHQRAGLQCLGPKGEVRDYYDEVEYRGDGYSVFVLQRKPGTDNAEFRGRCSWAQQPETVLYQRKVYEVALEPGGYYYLSAKEVPLDPAEVTTPQLGSGADAPVFTLADVTFEDVPFSSWPETTPEELDQRFGPVEDVETVVVHEFDGSCWETRVYDGISITCNREADGTGYTIGEITYERTDLPYVWDIRVGDSLETLLSTYRNEAWLYVPDEIEGYYCVSLYGTPIHMGTFALLEYRDGRPYDVMYQEGGAGVRFYLDDNCTISSIELFGGLFG